jgi:hypothetical protein
VVDKPSPFRADRARFDGEETTMAECDLTKRVADRQLSARSPLYRWLRIHYKELTPVLSVKRPGWKAIQEMILADGVIETPVTPSAVRKAWLLVERDMQPRQAPPPPTPAKPPAPPVALIDPAEPQPARRRFMPVSYADPTPNKD